MNNAPHTPSAECGGQSDAHTAMLELIAGLGLAHAVLVAAQLGVADWLRNGPRHGEALAELTGTHGPSLNRVLRLLAAAGLFAEDEEGRFSLTPLGSTLRADVPGSLRAWALVALGARSRAAWGGLLEGIRTAGIPFERVFGMDVWAHRAQDPADALVFDEAMGHLTDAYNSAVLAAYPFPGIYTVVDVGGGNGSFVISLLRAHPAMTAILFDLPNVAAQARQRIADAGLSQRCKVVAGDAFSALPESADAYVLSRVIHDWDHDAAVAILRNCRRAMEKSSRLLVIERVLPPRITADRRIKALVMSDVHMMVMNGGSERTAAGYRAILEESCFRLTEIVPTRSVMNVIVGIPD